MDSEERPREVPLGELEGGGKIQFVTGSFAEEPTRPVREYCDAFDTWRRAIGEALERGDFREDEVERWQKVCDAYDALRLPIRKSNLLYRLIYLGERLRTEKCDEHGGHWVGYGWDRECACQDTERGTFGPDMTGWLPSAEEEPE